MEIIKAVITDQISMDFEEALSRASQYVRHVEIHSLWNKTIEELSDDEIRDIARLLKKYDMQTVCLSTTLFLMCPLYGTTAELKPFSDKFLVYIGTIGDHMVMLEKCIDLADRLGSPFIRVFPFREEEAFREEKNRILAYMSDIFRHAARLAEKKEMCLVVENCPHSYLPLGVMTHDLCRRVKSENFRLLYDPGNSYRSGLFGTAEAFRVGSVMEEYEEIKKRINHFHFKDYRKIENKYRHVPLLEGDMNFELLYGKIVKDALFPSISLEPEVDAVGTLRSMEVFAAM